MNKDSWKTWVRQTIFLALAYYITGRLSLLLATPPGYATPIWPPTGLGIAALLLFGLNRWPGIFFGAFWVSYMAAPNSVAPWIALCIGTGNTLSIFSASLLIKRLLHYPKKLYREKDFIIFLFIAGPVSALISSVLGITSLSFFKQVHTNNLIINWMNWFIGDATGGIIFGPLALIFSIKSRRYWMKSVKSILIPLFISLFCVILSIQYLNRMDNERTVSEFNKKAENIADFITKELAANINTLDTLKSFFQSSEKVTYEEFHNFTKALVQNYPEIRAIGWQPQIDLEPPQAPFFEPHQGNEKLKDAPLTSNRKITDAFEKAYTENRIVATGPIPISALDSKDSSYIVLAATNSKGVFFEIIDVNKVIHVINDFIADSSYRVEIQDVTESTPSQILDSLTQTNTIATEFFQKDLSWFKTMSAADRTWKIQIYQDPALRTGATLSTAIFLFSLLLFTFLVCALLMTIANRFIIVQTIVDQKTLHLQEANLQLEKASKTKSEFLANMSHEIRTPLNVLIGMSDLLEESSMSEDQKHYLSLSKRAGHNLLNIINDILDISKIEAGLISLEKTDLHLAEIAQEVVDMFQMNAHEKGLEIFLYYNESLPTVFTGDPTRVRQILYNLVSNAVKFTHKGHIDIRISPNTSIDRPGNILVEITDTGIGIPADKINNLFQPFTQADSSVTRKFGGTGLGLSICKRLTEMMNGDIKVQSQHNQGSTFSFTLNLAESKIVPSQVVDQKSSVDTNILNDTLPLRILIVDDTEDNRKLIRAFLKQTSHTIFEAENGVKALEIFKQGQLDLILMDMQMPIMDGFTATLEIRKWEKEHHTAPIQIWALTAYALKNEIQRSFDVGCDLHLIKPVKKNDLLKHLSEMSRQIHKK